MGVLDIEFKFLDNVITHYNSEDNPVYGDIVKVVVNGQVFKETFNVSSLNKDMLYDRERARLFGEVLSFIGKDIERQAEYGKPALRTVNGKKLVWF